MSKEVVYCKYCNKLISRVSWVKTEEVSPRLFKTTFWCEYCQREFEATQQQERNSSWTTDGYILVKIPGIGWMKEHKYIWEKEHGSLPKGFVIHHINGDKSDNRLENLIAMPKKSHNPYLQTIQG